MIRSLLAALVCVTSLAAPQLGSAFSPESNSFAESFRITEPFLIQDVIVSSPRPGGGRIFLLTEPPAESFRTYKSWLPEIFGDRLRDHAVRQHPVGWDGSVSDIVVETDAMTEAEVSAAVYDIHSAYFGDGYKATYRTFDNKAWSMLRWPARHVGPPNLKISATSLHDWLFGENALRFGSDPFDTLSPAVAQAAFADLLKTQPGVYYSAPAGFVLMALGTGTKLEEQQPLLRRFLVDTDTLVGAVADRQGSYLVLIGRERTTSLEDMPPLRIDTILTLATGTTTNLAQSYERRMPFAGRIASSEMLQEMRRLVPMGGRTEAVGEVTDIAPEQETDLTSRDKSILAASVDWAPILLSRELTHTEYGQLLNQTDQMLKSWSNSNIIDYVRFPYPKPLGNPDARGLFVRLRDILGESFNSLTYNWNTSGFGAWTRFGEIEIFTVYQTGALPISYFPDVGEIGLMESQETVLKAAEDEYGGFFADTRDPNLARAAQYAALHVIFQKEQVSATRSEPLVDSGAYQQRWHGLIVQVKTALETMAGTAHPLDLVARILLPNGFLLHVPTGSECVLFLRDASTWRDDPDLLKFRELLKTQDNATLVELLVDPGAAVERFQAGWHKDVDHYNSQTAALSDEIDRYNATVKSCNETAGIIKAVCSNSHLDTWRMRLEKMQLQLNQEAMALEGRRAVFETRLQTVADAGSSFAAFGSCRAAWQSVVDGVPDPGASVYRTPGIVVSKHRNDIFWTGGHNLDGRSVGVEPDSSVAIGSVRIEAETGVIRLHPDDIIHGSTVVRTFERDYKRYLEGDVTFQSRVQRRVEAALRQDIRAGVDFAALRLARPAAPDTTRRGYIPESTGARVAAAPAARRLGDAEAAELVRIASDEGAQVVVHRSAGGVIEVSLPNGRPPVTIETRHWAQLPQAFEAMIELARTAGAGAEPLKFASVDGALTLGDMTAIKYSLAGRTAAGGGGDMLPPRGPRGILADPGGPRRPWSFFGRGGGENGFIPRRWVAYFGYRGRPDKTLLRRDADWAGAEIRPIQTVTEGTGGRIDVELTLGFREVGAEPPRLDVTLYAQFRERRPTETDREALIKAIEARGLDPEQTELFLQIEAIREEFRRAVGGEDGELIWELNDGISDFFVVEREFVPATHNETRHG